MPDDTHWYAGDDPALDDVQHGVQDGVQDGGSAFDATALPGGPVTPPALPGIDDDPADGPSRVGCRTELRGWAGAHLHGAVRPRRRAAGRGRPPGRWC